MLTALIQIALPNLREDSEAALPFRPPPLVLGHSHIRTSRASLDLLTFQTAVVEPVVFSPTLLQPLTPSTPSQSPAPPPPTP